jgi:anti-sigma regulatory factor (Ser/Thr protein kinase)/FixJ family two-component response regulator
MTFERPAVLLADTDGSSREMFRSFFSRRGWNCTVVTDVGEFGTALDHAGFDIVIADSEMPGLTPLLLLGEVFRKRPSQALVVVGESVTSDHGLRLLRSGVTDVITKPVDFAWLERCVEQAVCAKRQEDRERLTYKFVCNERTEMRFSCRQLGEAQAISLPIVGKLIATGQLAENDALRIRLAVQEALLNAVEHGNLELESSWKEETMHDGTDKFTYVRRQRMDDPAFADREVSIVSSFDGTSIEIVVKDQGKGFLHAGRPVSRVGDNVSCFGRGLTLICNAVDEVKYGDGGSQVTLLKKL